MARAVAQTAAAHRHTPTEWRDGFLLRCRGRTDVRQPQARSTLSCLPARLPNPSHPSRSSCRRLLTDALRTEMGFSGWVVSDCGAVTNIATEHHYLPNATYAAAAAIAAGVDLFCDPEVMVPQRRKQAGLQAHALTRPDTLPSYHPSQAEAELPKAVAMGLLPSSLLDTALYRVLLQQLKLGVYDPHDGRCARPCWPLRAMPAWLRAWRAVRTLPRCLLTRALLSSSLTPQEPLRQVRRGAARRTGAPPAGAGGGGAGGGATR